MAKLTAKQERFAEEYLIDLNATQAAIRAGYSDKTAYSMGQRLLKNVEVQSALQTAMTRRSQRTGVTQDWVLAELYKIASANRADFAKVVSRERPETVYDEETGNLKQVSRVSQCVELTDTEKLTDDQQAAISGVEETKFGIKVSTYDKVRALELIGKHLGMFTDKVELSGEVNTNSDKLDKILEQLNE